MAHVRVFEFNDQQRVLVGTHEVLDVGEERPLVAALDRRGGVEFDLVAELYFELFDLPFVSAQNVAPVPHFTWLPRGHLR